MGCEILSVDDESIKLANQYQKKILAFKFFNDGLHIAIATVNKIDIYSPREVTTYAQD